MSTLGHPAEGPASLMADGGQRIPVYHEDAKGGSVVD